MSIKKEAVIVDIDGTIADNSHRVHLVTGKNNNWDAFFQIMIDDKPFYKNIQIVQNFFKKEFEILIVTGRYEKHEPITRNWLNKHLKIDLFL